MRFYTHLAAISLALMSGLVSAADCDNACQKEKVALYFAALDAVSLKGSTTEDIDALLALMHEDVRYIHVEYQANFDKTSWRKAFLRNLNRDAYQDTEAEQIRIINMIHGKNHIAVEYSHGEVQPDGNWLPSDPYLAIFGFTNGKISLIKELW